MAHLLDYITLVSARCCNIVADMSRLRESDGLRDRVLLVGVESARNLHYSSSSDQVGGPLCFLRGEWFPQ